MTTVAELKDKLKLLGQHDEAEIDKMKKPELVAAIALLEGGQELELEGEVEEEEGGEIEQGPPGYNEEGWPEYVLSLFKPEELEGKHPKVGGLRRVAEMLLGPIVDSGPVQSDYSVNAQEGPGRAHCVFEVVFSPWMYGGIAEQRRFKSCADAFLGNVDGDFALYPSAMAETRAEARALRRALKLSVASADELSNDSSSKGLISKLREDMVSDDGEWDGDAKISGSQISFIKTKCALLKIDHVKFINDGKNQYSDIEEIAKTTAAKMIQRLNQYQSAEKVDIPEQIKLEN